MMMMMVLENHTFENTIQKNVVAILSGGKCGYVSFRTNRVKGTYTKWTAT